MTDGFGGPPVGGLPPVRADPSRAACCHSDQVRSFPSVVGEGQGGEPPPDAGSKPGQGQAEPPPISGGGSPEKGRPPRDRAAQDLVHDEPMTGTGATQGNGTHLLVLCPCRLGLSVTSCQDDEAVIEKDGYPGTARQRVVAVEAPRQRAKPPFSRRSEGCRWRQAMWT
jgi:hypothetical protein